MTRHLVVNFIIDRSVKFDLKDDGTLEFVGVDEEVSNPYPDRDEVFEWYDDGTDPTELTDDKDLFLFQRVVTLAFPFRFTQGVSEP